jgi:hypothetical protein
LRKKLFRRLTIGSGGGRINLNLFCCHCFLLFRLSIAGRRSFVIITTVPSQLSMSAFSSMTVEL